MQGRTLGGPVCSDHVSSLAVAGPMCAGGGLRPCVGSGSECPPYSFRFVRGRLHEELSDGGVVGTVSLQEIWMQPRCKDGGVVSEVERVDGWRGLGGGGGVGKRR